MCKVQDTPSSMGVNLRQTEPTKSSRFYAAGLAIAVLAALASTSSAWPKTPPSGLRFKVSFPASVHAEPITGRVFVVISNLERPEPRLQVGFWGDTSPLFGADVVQLKPGEA